jgi:hypothetical protein
MERIVVEYLHMLTFAAQRRNDITVVAIYMKR